MEDIEISDNVVPIDDLSDPIIEDDPAARVPDGIYEVMFLPLSKKFFRGSTKLYVWFVICAGPHKGTCLLRCYNWSSSLRHTHDLYKDLARIAGETPPRKSRARLSLLRKDVLRVRTRTVKKDRDGFDQPEHLWYSVISQILGVKESDEFT